MPKAQAARSGLEPDGMCPLKFGWQRNILQSR